MLDGQPLDEPIAASLRPWRYAVERSHPLTTERQADADTIRRDRDRRYWWRFKEP